MKGTPRVSTSRSNDARVAAVVVAAALASSGCFPDLDRFRQATASESRNGRLGATEDAASDAPITAPNRDSGAGGAPSLEAGPTASDAGGGAPDSRDAAPPMLETPYLDLRVTLVAMKPHHMSFFELFVIDANNVIQSHAILDPLGTENVTINMPYAVPKLGGPYRLDFYGDMNGTRSFDGLGSVIDNDHAWRLDPLEDYPKGAAHEKGAILVNFVHNTIFTDIDQYPSGVPNKAKASGVDARIDFSGMTAYTGKFMQLRVLEKVSGHMVGLYRFPSISEESFAALLPGVVDIGVDYRIDIYIDANGDGAYDNPETSEADRGFRLYATSDSDGLRVAFDPTVAPLQRVDVGPP